MTGVQTCALPIYCIVDKASFPRDKTCGDGLILYAYKSLKKLGLFDAFLSDERFLHSKKINLHVKDDLKVQFKESAEIGRASCRERV